MNNSTQSLIAAVETADSAPNLLKAVRALAQQKDPQGISTLIAVLGYNNPGAAVAAVEGLVSLGSIAVEPLLGQIDGYNYGARAWAVRVLARIGDPRALDLLIQAATQDFSQSVRRAAAKGLGNLIWAQLPPSSLPDAQKKVLDTLWLTLQDGEWVVRYAAVVGLESFARDNSHLAETILSRLQQLQQKESEMIIRARIQLLQTELMPVTQPTDTQPPESTPRSRYQ